MELYIFAALCWGLGGFINGIAGFGAALIAMPLVTQYVDLVHAVPAGTLIAITLCIQLGWTYRHAADWKRIRPLLLGALPGAITGATALSTLPEYKIKVAMGVFLLSYSLWSLLSANRTFAPIHKNWGFVAGFCSSAIGTAFGMGGPPTIIYATLSGWSKDSIKAGIASFFLCACSIMVCVQLSYGLHSLTSLTYFVFCAPAVAFGARLGILTSRKIGERSYRTIIYLMLISMALVILYRAIPQLLA